MKKYIVYHPLLFAIYPILFFYTYLHNMDVILFFDEVVGPLVVSSGLSLIFLLILKPIFGNIYKAALFLSIFLSIFFLNGHVFLVAQDLTGRLIGIQRYIYLIWFISLFSCFLLIKRHKGDLIKLTSYLNLVSFLLVVIPIIKIATHNVIVWNIHHHFIGDDISQNSILLTNDSPEELPDIYYLIPDRYISPYLLSSIFGYNNGEMIQYLHDKDFYIASGSLCNYPSTSLSLTSSLNMQYLPELAQDPGKDTFDYSLVFTLFRNNKVSRLLKSIGYRYIHIAGQYSLIKKDRYLDELIYYRNQSRFKQLLIEYSLVGPVIDKFFRDEHGSRGLHRKALLYEFDKLEEIVLKEGPKFVFAHIPCPHYPYVFKQNCEMLTTGERRRFEEKEAYLNQLICTNKQLRTIVDQILAKSTTDPIIIIQSDEGEIFNEVKSMETRRAMKTQIINAYHLPNNGDRMLYDSISPVNTFRIIFNYYFGADFTILEDKCYGYTRTRNEKAVKLVDLDDWEF
ncbi:hypothetical protein ACFL4G_12815 [Thermodesulfobacteriota bacterium]